MKGREDKMYKNKCDNCVKSNICVVNVKVVEVKQELHSQAYRLQYSLLDDMYYINKADVYFYEETKFGVRECKHYLEKNSQYLDEKNKKKLEQAETEKEIATAFFNALKLYPTNDGLNFNMSVESKEEGDDGLDKLSKICGFLIPVLGYAKAEIRTYEYGRKISDINFTLKKNNFGVSINYRCYGTEYDKGILIVKQYSNSISNDFDNYRDLKGEN